MFILSIKHMYTCVSMPAKMTSIYKIDTLLSPYYLEESSFAIFWYVLFCSAYINGCNKLLLVLLNWRICEKEMRRIGVSSCV